MQNKTINGFTLQRLLGTGGMAEVWYAENEIHKPAAVKILNADLSHNAQIVERFRNEAEIMVKLNHPNIRQVYGYGTIDDRPAIVMEYLDGNDLKARLKRGQRFTDEELQRWWNQLVDALNYTHKKGIVHRDIKPGNIFVDRDGNIKLLDFGIAKVRESISSTQTGQKLGTLMYMSPEQVKDSKHIDYRTDIYSLAVTFAHLITGKKPYDSDTSSDFEISEQIVYKPLDLSGLPVMWRNFLTPYLAKKSEDRPALRPFEAVASDDETDDEGTIVGDVPKKPEPPKRKPKEPESKPATKPKPKPDSNNPKSKKGLWIGIGAVVVIALIALLFMPKGNKEIPATETIQASVQTSSSDDLELVVNGVSYLMKPVEGGTFLMGAQRTNPNGQNYDRYACDDDKAPSSDYRKEGPVHSVTVNSFNIGETEITQALWMAVMGNTPECWTEEYGKGGNYPVYGVSWEEIVYKFLPKLNALTGKNFRLPTEAEWEYAARGGKKSNGYKYAGSNTIDEVAWYRSNSNGKSHTVKTKSPNELGLYDMSGNVQEWCVDRIYDYTSKSQNNPVFTQLKKRWSLFTSLYAQYDDSDYRMARGGSWDFVDYHCRVSARQQNVTNFWIEKVGFRIVLSR